MIVYPLTVGELRHQRLVQFTTGAIVNIFDACLRGFEPRLAQKFFKSTVLPPGQLAVDEHAKPFIEREALGGAIYLLIFKGCGHAGQA